MISLTLGKVGLPRYRYKRHLELQPGSGYVYTGSARKMYTHFNERKLSCILVLILTIHHKLNTRYNRAPYKFPVPVEVMEVPKVVAVSS